jgi:hypothetical protein
MWIREKKGEEQQEATNIKLTSNGEEDGTTRNREDNRKVGNEPSPVLRPPPLAFWLRNRTAKHNALTKNGSRMTNVCCVSTCSCDIDPEEQERGKGCCDRHNLSVCPYLVGALP